MSLLPLLAIVVLAALYPLQLVSAWSDAHMQFSNVGLKHEGFAGDTLPVNAGRCLELVPGSNNGQSADAHLWACRSVFDNNYRNQVLWRSGWSDVEVVAINFQGVDYCLDVEGGNAFPGARVRFYKCNDTPSQYWRAWADDKGRYRSHLDMNLCLDPAGGWDDDHNGQKLMLWHCHDGGEQQFEARPYGHFRSNLLWDMSKNCKSNAAFFCHFGCRGAGANTLINVLFEGVKLVCGLAPHPAAELACVSGAVLTQDALPDAADKCKCFCERWRRIPPIHFSVPQDLGSHSQDRVRLTVDGNATRVVSATDLVKDNPHLKTIMLLTPVQTPTTNSTAV